MINLDISEEIEKLDTQNVLGSIEALPRQIKQAWDEIAKLKIPESFKKATNIVVSGMGGSALGARVIQSTFVDTLSVPLTIVNGYDLPATVTKDTLVIVSSYSGTTEETLETYEQSLARNAMVFCISTGGTLAELSQKDKTPAYIFRPLHNPSNQPRMALGYAITSQIVLLAKLGMLKVGETEIRSILSLLKTNTELIGVHAPMVNNPIKALANAIEAKIPVLIGGEFLAGSLHTLRNQFNENSKTYADYHIIPELNHHLMEGLKHPPSNPTNLYVIFFYSKLYPDKIALRFKITQEIVSKNNISSSSYQLNGQTKFQQAMELIHIGSYLNFYEAVLYGQNPAPIPWVDYFKEKLKRAPL